MLAVYKRLGSSISGKMLRLAKPLRVDRSVRQMIKNPVAQRVLTAVGNTLLRVASRSPKTDQSLEVTVHSGYCGQEFTVLAQEQVGLASVCTQRTAEYLNWRYLSNPLARYEIVAACNKDRLVGYAVWTKTEQDASIVDLFGNQDPGIMRRLIAEIVDRAQNHGAITVSVSVNDSYSFLPMFWDMGFRLRESSPVVIIPSKSFAHKIDLRLTGWYLMHGDRDS
jgi:hypothetical protein